MADQRIKVLIVDDEDGILDYMHKILDLKGYQTFVAIDANTAIAVFEEHRPDICLLDVHLSNSILDGVQVLEKFKAVDPGVECVMVTRITDEDKIKRSGELGAAGYLLKPIDTKDVLSMVNDVAAKIKERRSCCG